MKNSYETSAKNSCTHFVILMKTIPFVHKIKKEIGHDKPAVLDIQLITFNIQYDNDEANRIT